MAKRSIYFPEDLEKQMAKFQENWSVVCQEAAIARIKILEDRSKTFSSAIERARKRLAEDRVRYAKTAHERGRIAGTNWAADKAEFIQLRRLSEAMGQFDLVDGHTAPRVILSIIGDQWDPTEETEVDGADVMNFCESVGMEEPVTDDGSESLEFWWGFVEAAVEVFDQL